MNNKKHERITTHTMHGELLLLLLLLHGCMAACSTLLQLGRLGVRHAVTLSLEIRSRSASDAALVLRDNALVLLDGGALHLPGALLHAMTEFLSGRWVPLIAVRARVMGLSEA